MLAKIKEQLSYDWNKKIYLILSDDGNMDKDMKETVLRAVDCTNTEAERYNRRVRICNGIALLFVLAYIIMKDTSLYTNSACSSQLLTIFI